MMKKVFELRNKILSVRRIIIRSEDGGACWMIAKEPGHVSQRIFLHYYIGINEENYAAMHFSNAPIPGGSRSALRPEFEHRYIVSPRQLRALIGRAIIDNENFIIME